MNSFRIGTFVNVKGDPSKKFMEHMEKEKKNNPGYEGMIGWENFTAIVLASGDWHSTVLCNKFNEQRIYVVHNSRIKPVVSCPYNPKNDLAEPIREENPAQEDECIIDQAFFDELRKKYKINYCRYDKENKVVYIEPEEELDIYTLDNIRYLCNCRIEVGVPDENDH